MKLPALPLSRKSLLVAGAIGLAVAGAIDHFGPIRWPGSSPATTRPGPLAGLPIAAQQGTPQGFQPTVPAPEGRLMPMQPMPMQPMPTQPVPTQPMPPRFLPVQPMPAQPATDQEATAQERQYMGIAAPRGLFEGSLHGATPNRIPGGQVITTPGLVALLRQGMAVHVFDVLGSSTSLPNAIPAVFAAQPGGFDDRTQRQLADLMEQATRGRRDDPVVFYCLGLQCRMSYNAAVRAIQLGFRNVLWYRGGLEAWQSAGQPVRSGDLAQRQPDVR